MQAESNETTYYCADSSDYYECLPNYSGGFTFACASGTSCSCGSSRCPDGQSPCTSSLPVTSDSAPITTNINVRTSARAATTRALTSASVTSGMFVTTSVASGCVLGNTQCVSSTQYATCVYTSSTQTGYAKPYQSCAKVTTCHNNSSNTQASCY